MVKVLITKESQSFIKLQELTVANIVQWDHPRMLQEFMKIIIAKSPNLKKIFFQNGENFCIPLENIGLVGNLYVHLQDFYGDQRRVERILEKQSKLRRLTLTSLWGGFGPRHFHVMDKAKGYGIVWEVMHDLLIKLLQLCEESLEELLRSSLKKLSKLTLKMGTEDEAEDMWKSLASIASQKMMPKLSEVIFLLVQPDPRVTVNMLRWPALGDAENIRQEYSSVRKLVLDLQVVTYTTCWK